jgi:hypothetical protein
MNDEMNSAHENASELTVTPEQENVSQTQAEVEKHLDMAFCLLYVSKNEENFVNMRFGGIESYLYCASYLCRSLERADVRSTILTNDKEFIIRHCPPLKDANVIQLNFELDIPTDVAFRSAHHKIDIINYIGKTYTDGMFLILDVDVVCVSRAARHFLRQAVSKNDACVLDISHHVYPAYGQERVRSDIRLLSRGQLANWFGGEFLLGTASFFRRLAQELAAIWPDYVAHRHGLHHQGDEAVVSAALCKMLEKNESVVCVQLDRAIVRWWNAVTAHRQVSLHSALQTGLLHLPSDKNFIKFCAKAKLSPRYFPALYFAYASMLMPAHLARATFNLFRQRRAIHAPRLF